jgi:putative transposase
MEMPRHARFVLPRVPLHIVHRGNNRQKCFWEDVDRRVYLRLLETHAAMTSCDVHSFVFMPNHVHILITPEDADSPARMMKGLAQNYSQYANRRHRRTGSLWEGRFWSGMVGDGDYVMRCQRYIELNPVRAGLVTAPGSYDWSSFRSNVGLAKELEFLTPHPLFLRLSSNEQERRIHYMEFVAMGSPDGELEEIRAAVKGGFPWGDSAFLQRVEDEFGSRAVRGRSREQDRSALLEFH